LNNVHLTGQADSRQTAAFTVRWKFNITRFGRRGYATENFSAAELKIFQKK
jgi:hypothetical protein